MSGAMTEPREPEEPDFAAFEPEFVPPDPDEPPPVDLGAALGDVAPWGTVALLLSWAMVFAVLAFRREIGDTNALYAWGASAPGLPPLETAWRLLASTFVHAGMAHVFFNALSMIIFGPATERMFSRPGFWVIYAAGGAIASLGSLAWRHVQHPHGYSISVGASGAIFALGGALLASAWRVRKHLAVGRARAMGAALLFLIVQSLSAGFTRNATDNAAHAAGLVAGMALGAVIPLNPRLGGPAWSAIMRPLGVMAALALAVSLALGARGGLRY